MEVEQAYRHCFAIASAHAENFPTASRLLPREQRQAVAAIYAFARLADDLADEGNMPVQMRRKRLDAWEELLVRAQRGADVPHPVFYALADAIRRFHLPVAPLHDLLVAFRMDTEVHAYAGEQELLFYCQHSAAPIGRLLLHLFGVHRPQAHAASDALCIGLQLVNFWQDIAIDLARGRCYLPAEWLAKASLTPEDMLAGRFTEAQLAPVWEAAYAFTERQFSAADPLPTLLPRRLAMQAAASLAGGRRLLARLRHRRALGVRPTLSAADKLMIALYALGRGIA